MTTHSRSTAQSPRPQATLNWVKGNQSFSATLQAFERQGVAHTLAEPTVTAVSGESAKFLAGGTIPILNGECSAHGGSASSAFIQQPYGVTLNFTPVVLSEGRIQLRIATEVTDIDYSTQITFSGTSIPGFRTRKNDDHGRIAVRRLDRLGRPDLDPDAAGDQRRSRR